MNWIDFKKIPRNVMVLGLVSFFNDVASEMVYPIVPLFLTSVLHASVPVVGLIEGIAEGISSISKYGFGTFSDYVKKRKIFVVSGYSMSALSKILMSLSYSWPFILFARIIDRVGKGVRTAPRDSILLENTTPTNKGYLFGFHRAFDSLGAVVGPLLALLLLYLVKDNMRLAFVAASIPAGIAIFLLVFLVHEKKRRKTSEKKEVVKISFSNLQPRLKIFLLVSFLFALGNSSDSFLLLYAKNLGLGTTLVVLLYVLYNISQTVFATPAGALADRIGAKRIYLFGLLVFALVYAGFGLTANPLFLWILFPVYGIYIAATDGVSKSYIAEFITAKESGTYFGAYYTLIAVGGFLASFIGGLIWRGIAPSFTFYYGSLMALIAFAVFSISEYRTYKKYG